LPRGHEIVTKERLEKGDLLAVYDDAGRLKHLEKKVNNPLEFLFFNHKIDSEHYQSALTLSIWRDIHQTQLGLKKATSFSIRQFAAEKIKALGYVVAIRKLTQSENKVFNFLVEDSHIKSISEFNLKVVRGVLFKIHDAVARAEEALEALNNMSDLDKIEFAEENLQKYIAELKKR
jgi:hypothetical protein